MCRRIHFSRLVFAASALVGAELHAQRTGTLIPAVEQEALASVEALAKRERQERFAALVADPSLSSTLRSSAWTMSFTAFQQGQEAKLQANVCDILADSACKKSAIDLTLIAPVKKGEDVTEAANLSGLAGAARLELGGTLWLAEIEDGLGWYGPSVRVVVGRPSFDFRTPADLSQATVRRTIYSLAATLPFYKTDRTISSIGYRYDNAFKAASSQNVCVTAPFGPPGTQTCNDLVIGGPKQAQTRAAEFEYRRSFRIAAAALTVTRDFANEVTGFDLPIWVVPNQSGGLGGGVRFGYRTDTKRLTAALFVSEFKL